MSSVVTTPNLMMTLDALKEWGRERQDYIRTENNISNRMKACIRRRLGFAISNKDTENAAIKTKATSLFQKYCANKRLTDEEDEIISSIAQLPTFRQMLALVVDARDKLEKQIAKKARTLPGYGFVKTATGFGDLTFGVIIGMTGDLSNYKTHNLICKRLGLAPFMLENGVTCACSNMPKHQATNMDYIKAGYNKTRRADVYACLEVNLLKHQLIGKEKSGTEYGAPKGPYGKVYVDRRIRNETTHPDWSKGRSSFDASRVMAQAVIRDLHRHWKQDQQTAIEHLAA